MAYVDEVADRDETISTMYREEQESWGFVPNFTRTFSLHPEVYRAWKGLNGALKATMQARRYEVATVAAAAALRSSYCTLAHGRILADRFMKPDEVAALVAPESVGPGPDVGGRAADSPAAEDSAVAAFARKVALHADRITEDDVTDLRSVGLSDAEVFEVVLAASARCFFSKTLDATGTPPDSAFLALEPGFRAVLTVGRPIDGGS